jgi:hypothetical protein
VAETTVPSTSSIPSDGNWPQGPTLLIDRQPTIEELFEDGRAIAEALLRVAAEARQLHKRLGHPMASWQDGKVVWIRPEDLDADDLAARER